MFDRCEHVSGIDPNPPRTTSGCKECEQLGWEWVHLRQCMICGHVGCCDSSRGKHATAHFHETGHSVMRSVQPGETWMWCFPHSSMVGPDGELL